LSHNLLFLLIIFLYLNIYLRLKLNFIFLFFFLELLYFNKLNIDITYNININLINGLFLIHPILIYLYYAKYVSLLFIIMYFLTNYNYFNVTKNKLLFDVNLNLIKFEELLIIILMAIFLGAWWAYQELS